MIYLPQRQKINTLEMTCESVDLQNKQKNLFIEIGNMEKTRSMIKKLDNIKWCNKPKYKTLKT